MAAEEKKGAVQADSGRNSGEMEIDLVELMYRLLEKARYIIIAALAGALLMGIYTFRFVTPMYKATSKLYILNSKDSVVNLSDLQIGSSLASDYVEVFSNWHVHDLVIQRMGLEGYTYSDMQSMVSVSNKSATRILYITVTSPDPQQARDVANAYAEVSREFIASTMGTDMPSIFEEARLPVRPASPNKARNIAIGFIVGALIAMAVIIIQFIVDDRIRSADAIEHKLGLSVLGNMPEQQGNTTGAQAHHKHHRDGKRRSKQ